MPKPMMPAQAIATRYGPMITPANERDLIGRFLREYGEWAGLETKFLSTLLPRDSRILDVGAFIGTFSLGIAVDKPISYSCLIEANEYSLPILQQNIQQNAEFSNDVIYGVVGSENALAQEGRADPDNAGSTSFDRSATGADIVAFPTETIAIDEIVSNFGPFDLIKLDVEGMEMSILKTLTMSKCQNSILWVECNENIRSLHLVDFLLSLNRDVYYYAWPSYNKQNFKGSDHQIFPFAYEAGLLVVTEAGLQETAIIPPECILRPIRSATNLQAALWQTPRWGEQRWRELSLPELAGIASHSLAQTSESSFLSEQGSDDYTKMKNIVALAQFERQTLEQELSQLNTKYAACLRSSAERGRRNVELEDRLVQLQDSSTLREDRIATLQRGATTSSIDQSLSDKIEALEETILNIRSSRSWRFGNKMARLAKSLPILSSILKRLIK
ncbi:FkbM family methyltransferase [Devosia sp. SL43]|uniref:FkbM family methyltransferase n=1 Tax=Devosia sp. SL43 TaxID=2806348 RepID=UPI001F0271C3|nr:FkbM family methyltransferase [Devosia sp. SL43]UJW85857.1 FkbM family methyltransferase [Devosia sp. SL43]